MKSFPALRAGFVVLTDRYIFSIMARAIARGEDRAWIERTAGFALVPHVVLYLRADVKDLISRVVVGRGAFDYWESGLDLAIRPRHVRQLRALSVAPDPGVRSPLHALRFRSGGRGPSRGGGL